MTRPIERASDALEPTGNDAPMFDAKTVFESIDRDELADFLILDGRVLVGESHRVADAIIEWLTQ
jgi:hypothetical protein